MYVFLIHIFDSSFFSLCANCLHGTGHLIRKEMCIDHGCSILIFSYLEALLLVLWNKLHGKSCEKDNSDNTSQYLFKDNVLLYLDCCSDVLEFVHLNCKHNEFVHLYFKDNKFSTKF